MTALPQDVAVLAQDVAVLAQDVAVLAQSKGRAQRPTHCQTAGFNNSAGCAGYETHILIGPGLTK